MTICYCSILTASSSPTPWNMAGCLIRNPDGSEQAGCLRSLPTPWSGLLRALHLSPLLSRGKDLKHVDLVHNPLPTQSIYIEAISGAFMMVSRQALEQVGVMDEDYFLHCEDLDWCQEFHDAGWNILFIPGIEIVHHKGACSAERPVFVLWHKHKGMARFYNKFLSRSYPMLFNWLVVLGIWSRFAMMMPVSLYNRLRSRQPAEQESLPQVAEAGTPPGPQAMIPALNGSRCLVTGATGFIGYRLVKELLRQGAQVRTLSRGPSLTTVAGVERVIGDVRDPNSLKGLCTDIDHVFHLAGCAHQLDGLESHDRRHHDITVTGTRNLLDEALASGVKRLVFISSVKTMGEVNQSCQSEEVTPAPVSAYGIAKLQAEQDIMARRDEGLQPVVLRLPLVYGPGNKGNLPRMMQAIDKGRFPPLPKVANRRSMVHVDDVIQAMLLCATHPKADGRTYLVTDGRTYSTWEIYRDIAASLGHAPPRWSVTLPLISLGARFGDLLNKLHLPVSLNSITLHKLFGSAWYDDTRIRRELGYDSRFDLHDALPQMAEELARGDAEEQCKDPGVPSSTSAG